jgi:hypothetical protein
LVAILALVHSDEAVNGVVSRRGDQLCHFRMMKRLLR